MKLVAFSIGRKELIGTISRILRNRRTSSPFDLPSRSKNARRYAQSVLATRRIARSFVPVCISNAQRHVQSTRAHRYYSSVMCSLSPATCFLFSCVHIHPNSAAHLGSLQFRRMNRGSARYWTQPWMGGGGGGVGDTWKLQEDGVAGCRIQGERKGGGNGLHGGGGQQCDENVIRDWGHRGRG